METPPPPPQSTPAPPPPSTPQPSEAPQTQIQDPPPPPSSQPPSTTTTSQPPPPTPINATTPTPAPVTSSTPSPLPSTSTPFPQSAQNIQPRLPTAAFSRPWQQPPPSALPVQGGGMAIGVPTHHPAPLPAPSSAFNTPPFGYARNLPDSLPTSSTSQVRQPIQGMGITGSLGASASVRPTGVPGHQLRAMQPPVGPPSGLNMHPPATQNFQGQGMFRGQSLGPSGSSAPNTGQTLHPQNQPWLSSAAQGKSPLPPPSIRPQINPQAVQQRTHVPQQKQQTIPTTMQQQQSPSLVKQLSNPSQALEQIPQQYPPPRAQLSVPQQQQMGKSPGLGIQRSSSLGVMQAVAEELPNRNPIEETEEPCNKILSKRTIQELLNQIDPSEKLEPEVEEILVDIAEDFVESITTFGCSLAKHRKSTVLEAKDILLHVERNWNMTLPGYGGDEIKIYKKPLTSDLHKERLAVIKKSIVASESTNAKNSAGQAAGGNPKSHSAKGSAIMLGSPNT